MNTPTKASNAWIFIGEDDPSGSSYTSPDSSYQSLINNNLFASVDMMNICFFELVPTSSKTCPTGDGSTYTLDMINSLPPHPNNISNQQYMEWLITDSPNGNPSLKILATLNYSELSYNSMYKMLNSPVGTKAASEAFAQNLVAYLDKYGLNGFDIDWESPFPGQITADDFSTFLVAVRAQYNTDPATVRYLTLSPNTTTCLQSSSINTSVDFINLQTYGGLQPTELTDIGVLPNLLSCGVLFEGNPYNNNLTADAAYQEMQDGFNYNNQQHAYPIVAMWRLNSGNFFVRAIPASIIVPVRVQYTAVDL